MKTIHQIKPHMLREGYSEKTLISQYKFRLYVEDKKWDIPMGIGAVLAGGKARQEMNGEEVEGPWAYTFNHAAVLTDTPNKLTPRNQAFVDRLLIEAKIGDLLDIAGDLYEITWENAGKANESKNWCQLVYAGKNTI